MIGEKRRWWQYKARTKRLPERYRTAIGAIERYLMYAGGVTQSDAMLAMFDDLADLFEQAAADGTAIRDIVGEDPVEFVEAFLRNYTDGQWITRERQRLNDTIKAVADANR
jgi:DNA-binding ferritin-like protein (Dps family)